jgi:acyl-CoA hydrolase
MLNERIALPKANTLSLVSKIVAVLIVVTACIASIFFDKTVDMGQIIAGAGFIAASFITVDISKIKTSQKEE